MLHVDIGERTIARNVNLRLLLARKQKKFNVTRVLETFRQSHLGFRIWRTVLRPQSGAFDKDFHGSLREGGLISPS